MDNSALKEIIGETVLARKPDSDELYQIPFDDFFNLQVHGSEYLCLYFGAHWAPPCRIFTTQLDKFYRKVNKDSKKIEVIFVTEDREKAHFERNFAKMPWFAVPFEDEH